MTNDPDLDDCAFLSGNERLPNQLAMQILFQLFNRIYPATSLPLFCSVVHLQQLITFTVFPFTFWSGGESSGGRQTRTGVAVCSQRRALLVAGIVLGSLLLTAIIIAYAGPQNGRLCIVQIYLLFGCVSVCFLSYSFSLSFSFFFLCFYHNKNNHKSFGLFCIYALQSICALGTRMRWGEILQG